MHVSYTESMKLSAAERLDVEFGVIDDDARLLEFMDTYIPMLVEDVAPRIKPELRDVFGAYLRSRVLEIRNKFRETEGYKHKTALFTLFILTYIETIFWDWEDEMQKNNIATI